MEPAGPEKGVGIITSAYLKDPTDPGWAQRRRHGRVARPSWRSYMPDGDLKDGSYLFAYGVARR